MTNGLFDFAEGSPPVNAEPFDALETKINEVLERLTSLQAEKVELQRQVEQLRTRHEEAARQVEELTRERDALKRNQRDTTQEALIRSKIAALLAKLESA